MAEQTILPTAPGAAEGPIPLDPELAALRDSRPPAVERPDVATYRAMIVAGHAATEPGPEVGGVSELHVAGVPIRLYEPTKAQAHDAGDTPHTVVYVHGGGWVLGDLDFADEPCRLLCAHLGARVVNVDYRLAPEHPFPAGLQDVEAVIAAAASRWPGQVTVIGDSAGANLATVAVRHLHTSGAARIDLQVLLYPVVDPEPALPSRTVHTWPISAADMDWYYHQYLPAGPGDPAVADPDVSPLRSRNLAGLPRTHVVVAGHDPLRDEALAYVARLRELGVEVSLRDHRDLPHGFLRFSALSSGARAARDILVQDLKSLLVH